MDTNDCDSAHPDPKCQRAVEYKKFNNAMDTNDCDSAHPDPKCQRAVEYKKFNNAMDTNDCDSAHPDPKCQNAAHELRRPMPRKHRMFSQSNLFDDSTDSN
ncbi:uncharacterized protein LOC136079833 [Hydra vulgaris]|uniref:Uncharacterized protein LOC136079833 n=1 Tax=Hydra vulgaris TaxID=6087 RepID=A0ABM4BTQ1_HYDVU